MVTGTSERCFWLSAVFVHSEPHGGRAYVMSFRIVINIARYILHSANQPEARIRTAIEKFPLPDIGKLQYVINGKIADLQPLLRCWSTQYNDAALLPLGNRI